MAGFASDSDCSSDYGYDLTASDEELLLAIVDQLSPVAPPRQSRPGPLTPARRSDTFAPSIPARRSVLVNTSPDANADATLAIDETIAAISDEDLTFDISELDEPPADHVGASSRPGSAERQSRRRLAPSVSADRSGLSSFVSKTKPRSIPTLLPGPDVRYPDLSRALSEAEKAAESPPVQARRGADDPVEDNRPPILRFRTFPMKPFSVSDLTAGSWCELQYYYTLTQLQGRKTRTAAMKRGTEVHERLEREVYTPVAVDVVKKEDAFGLRIWNIIQGLRTLRDTGLTRELEVWGMVDGNIVNGVIDGLSYENPDPELQEEVLSSRGGSQRISDSQSGPVTEVADYEIYITDVKTRTTATPPPRAQVRVAIIQLFLYHRFLTQMATDQLDYLRVFERYGLNPDEPFSDSFMAQIGALQDEVFAEVDAQSARSSESSDPVDSDGGGGFVSAPSSPSQLDNDLELGDDGASLSSLPRSPKLKYRTLRALLPLLKFEIRLTFPRGAADLGQIVAVEYRYRSRDRTPPATPADSPSEEGESRRPRPRRPEQEEGAVICTNTFFVEPHTLDLYLSETLRWWKGEREPHGVVLEEAFKCRSCEFVEGCEWRRNLDMEAIRRAKVKMMKEKEADAEGEAAGGESHSGKKRGRRKRSAMPADAAVAAGGVAW